MLFQKTINIITPVYNEEECLLEFISNIKSIIYKLNYKFNLVFIDDGSTDNSLFILNKIKINNGNVFVLRNKSNQGQQKAIYKGLKFSRNADAVIIIDSDLQDPIETIVDLINSWKAGYEIVNTKYQGLDHFSLFKRILSIIFYELIGLIWQNKINKYSGEFRLLSKMAVGQLLKFNNNTLFIRAIINQLKLNHTCINIQRNKRFAGKSKYKLIKVLQFGFMAIRSLINK